MLTPSRDPTEADFAGKLRLVYGISRLLSAALEEHGLLQRACTLLANNWPSPHVTFVEGVADGSVKLRAFAGELSQEAAAAVTMQSRWDASARAQNTIGEAFRSGTPIMMRAADIPYQPYRDYALRSGIAAAASFPIWIEDQRGALTIATYNPAAFSDLELELLQGLTEDIARTVEQVRTRYELFEERRRAQARLERLEALWEFASGNLDVEALARAIVAEGTARLHLDWGGIARIAGERVCFDVVPEDDPLDMARVSAPLHQSVTGHAHLVGRTVHCPDILADPEYSRLKRDGTRGLRAIIAAPFSAGPEGHVLIFGSPAPREQPFPAEDIEYVELLAAFFARNLQRREDLQQIAFLQNHDPLSGLPNRFNFLQQLRQAFARAERGGEPLAVLLIDIERFKAIADEHGTEMAEQSLLELRNRLQRTLGPDDTLFRHARDGFAVIKTRWPAIGDVDAFAHRTIAALEEPIALGEASLRVAIYAGLAISPDDGRNAEDLEIAAEAALRRAKREAVSGHRFYSSELDAQLAHRRMISLELRRAIENERLVLHFQPIVNVATSATISYEALVRWPHPERGIIMPGHFIPLAEESDLIVLLGDFVLRSAARAARTFVERGLMLPIAVNISAAQFADPRFLERLRATLAQAGVAPAMIELELTESVAMRDPHLTRALMQECRALGVRIALDDFGTGHSSLAVLRRLPIEILKLDKTFVAGLPDDVEDAAIARAVLALGKSLRCEVRAEGVETEDQAAWLRGEGCDSAQGYFFSRPQPPESFGLA